VRPPHSKTNTFLPKNRGHSLRLTRSLVAVPLLLVLLQVARRLSSNHQFYYGDAVTPTRVRLGVALSAKWMQTEGGGASEGPGGAGGGGCGVGACKHKRAVARARVGARSNGGQGETKSIWKRERRQSKRVLGWRPEKRRPLSNSFGTSRCTQGSSARGHTPATDARTHTQIERRQNTNTDAHIEERLQHTSKRDYTWVLKVSIRVGVRQHAPCTLAPASAQGPASPCL
jgi:hypothetical protein